MAKSRGVNLGCATTPGLSGDQGRCPADPPIHGDFSEASGSAAARALLACPGLPEAVACANDQMAIGLLREFRRAGVVVLGDVAVTGFDDIYPSRMTDPPLITVSQPPRDLGTRAAHRSSACTTSAFP